MTSRAARIVSRSLLALAVLMIGATGVIAFTSFDRAEPGRIVVVPAQRAPEIRQAADALDDACRGDVSEPALADAPYVYCELRQRQADGHSLSASPTSPFALAIFGVSLLWLATGGMVSSRQPGNLAGWIFQVIGVSIAAEIFAFSLAFMGTKARPGSVPFLDLWALIGEFALIALALLPMLWMLFPDGRPPSPRWRWAVRIYFGALALALLASLFGPGPLNNFVDAGILFMNPLGVPELAGVAGVLTAVGVVTMLGIAVAAVVGIRGRFRRSDGEQRQQLRWLRFVTTIAAVLVIIMFVGGAALDTLVGEHTASEGLLDAFFGIAFALLAGTIAVGIPAAYLIAIFRHGLWELDLVIKKTVQYSVLLAIMTLLAVGVVIGIPALVVGSAVDVAFGQVVLLATLLAATFTWIRGPVRRLADRIVFGKRASPYEVLSEFSERIRETYAADDVLPRMAAVLGEGTSARRSTVWLRVGADLRPEAVWPADAMKPASLPEEAVDVTHQGQQLGALSVEMPADDPLDPARRKLIADLASQAGLVLRNVRLIEELRASRQRLVAAQDAERRRIERNIHDGAQQQLVALQVQLKLARATLDRDVPKAAEMLDALQVASGSALEDLRDLARGIYPPLLADRGLTAALEAQARKAAIPVRVDSEGVGRFPQEIEATVYFCCLEALTNTAKYAEASQASVSLARADGSLTFAVSDDGRGFDPAETGYGTGLQGMADRLDAVGGALEVESSPGRGTVVRGRVRVASEVEDG